MNKNLAILFTVAALALPSVSFAKSGPHNGETIIQHHSGDAIGKLDDARSAYRSAEAACGRAQQKYGDKVFNAGGHDAEEIRSRGHDKDSACNQALGAHTAYLNALHAASGEYAAEVAALKKALEKASKDDKGEIQKALTAAEKSQVKCDQEYAANSASNTGGRGKH